MERKKSLFTIIIPTFNRAKLLKKAIQSVIDQTISDWELVIIDDGSTDNTQEIVMGIEDQRIQYVFQEKKERSVARNLGIQEAKGSYICFLDDDDEFLENHLKILSDRITLEGSPIGIFRTGMIIKEEGKKTYSKFYDAENNNPINFFLNEMVGIHTLCFHFEILKIYKYDERWWHFQDTHLLVRCLLKFPFYQINNYTAIYHRYPQMGSRKIFLLEEVETRTENNVSAIEDLFKQGGTKLLTFVPRNTQKRLMAEKYLQHANGALGVGKKKLARKYLRKSLSLHFVSFYLYLRFIYYYLRCSLK